MRCKQLLAHHLPLNSVLARNIRPSMPFILLAVLLFVRPGLRHKDTTDPLSGVDPPPPALAVTYMDPRLAKINKLLFLAFVTAVCLAVIFFLPGLWVSYLAEGLALDDDLPVDHRARRHRRTDLVVPGELRRAGCVHRRAARGRAGTSRSTPASSSARSSPPCSVRSSRCRAFASVVCTCALGTLVFALMLQNTLFVRRVVDGV